ncbi:MAG TPA: prolyl oligopeptidase family serine peptidase, partial [Woeseiaceae bacterium]|nr:prolyl oligopeptidase family serine peptidase [Woeseiaceae bacterium]
LAYQRLDPRRITPRALDVPVPGYGKNGLPHRFAASDIFLLDMANGTERRLPGARGGNLQPHWSPDGRRLAFVSDRGGVPRIWIWEAESNTVSRLSPAVVAVDENFASTLHWSPDGNSVFARLCLQDESISDCNRRQRARGSVRTMPPSSARILDSRSSLPSWFSAAADLAQVSVPGGEIRRLLKEQRFQWFQPSPDGTRLAVMSVQEEPVGYPRDAPLVISVLDVSTAKMRVLAQTDAYPPYSWSPDGRYLAFPAQNSSATRGPGADEAADAATGAGEGTPADAGTGRRVHVIAVDAVHEPERSITAPLDEQPLGWPGILWSEDSAQIYFVGDGSLWRAKWPSAKPEVVRRLQDGRRIEAVLPAVTQERVGRPQGLHSLLLITINHRFEQGLVTLDTGRRRLTTVMKEKAVHFDRRVFAGVAAGERPVGVFMLADGQEGNQLWQFESGKSGLRQLSRFNPSVAAAPPRGRIALRWQGTNGAELGGYVIVPPDYDPSRRYPLILQAYAGNAEAGRIYSSELEDAADRILPYHGYVVLHADSVLREGTPMTDIAASMMPGVRQAIAAGIGDAERIGVWGHSYGGYSVLSLIVQSPLFKAAAASAPVADLISFYGQLAGGTGVPRGIDWAESGQGRMGGSLWEQRQRYVDNSPLFFLDRVQTPLLLLHGLADDNISAAQSAEVYSGLLRLGKPVKYLQFDAAGHQVQFWGFNDRVEYYRQMLDWFDRHLKATP